MARGLTVLPPRRTGLGDFSEAIKPYLQMAFQSFMKRQSDAPKEKREEEKMQLLRSAEERSTEKEKRTGLESVSKGLAPLASLPPEVIESVAPRAQFNTTGLGGSPEALALTKNIPRGATFQGKPSFMSRVTPEIPIATAERGMRGSFATQQQAGDPYKEIGSIKASLMKKVLAGTATKDEKRILGILDKAKDFGFGEEGELPTGSSEEDIKFTMKKHGLSREEVLRRLSK